MFIEEILIQAADHSFFIDEPEGSREAKETDTPCLCFEDIVWPFRIQPQNIGQFPNSVEEITQRIKEYLIYRTYHPGITWQEKYYYLCRDWDEKCVEENLFPMVVEMHREDVKEAYERLRVVLDEMQKKAGRIVMPKSKQKDGDRKWDICHWDECL